MSVIFNGTEVTDIVMDGTNVEAVVYNGVCVFGAVAFLKSGPDIRDLLTPYYTDQGVRKYVSTIHIQKTYPTNLPSTASVVRQVTLSKDDSPYLVTAYYIRASSSANVINLYIVPENEAIIVLDPDCSYMFSLFQNVTRITFVSGVINTSSVSNMNGMFGVSSDDTTLTGIYGLNEFDTSAVENMSGMFMGRRGMTYADVSGFDTSKVTDMGVMFYNCSALETIDVSGFDTSNVTDMGGMFTGCSGVSALDVSGFDTSNVTDMGGMFTGCSGVSALDVSGFDTSNVERMQEMFMQCSDLTTIYASDQFVTSSIVTEEGYKQDYNMFMNCPSLVGGNGTVYDANHVDAEYARIDTAETPGYFTAAT